MMVKRSPDGRLDQGEEIAADGRRSRNGKGRTQARQGTDPRREEGNELKINDDETMEPIHGPQIMQGGKPGVIIPTRR